MHWKAIIKESSETVLVVTIPYAVNRLNDLARVGHCVFNVAIQRPSWLYSDRCGNVWMWIVVC